MLLIESFSLSWEERRLYFSVMIRRSLLKIGGPSSLKEQKSLKSTVGKKSLEGTPMPKRRLKRGFSPRSLRKRRGRMLSVGSLITSLDPVIGRMVLMEG